VTELLVRWRAGDQGALEELVPLVYKQLRDIARHHLQHERPGHTLQSAALVHEAYLRLVDQRPFDTENHAHFLAVASRLMRQILVDYARSHGAAKRGADRMVELDTSVVLPQVWRADVVALDDALNGLARLDEQQGTHCRDAVLRRTGYGGDCRSAGNFRVNSKTGLECSQSVLTRQMKKGSRGKTGAVAEN
jgi:RNA polymerase sigma factor (TIGR02999 family)